MTTPDHAVQVELRVPFHDCDPLAVVWHGRYFQYLEASRTELFRSCRLDVSDMVELGLRMFVTDARCRYNHPLGYGDRFVVGCWFSERSPLLRVSYDVMNLTRGRRSARAYTRLALTDRDGELLKEIPEVVRERLPQ